MCDSAPKTKIEDDDLPDYVRRCGACDGAGEYPQRYTAGCGMGYYTSMGRCDVCRDPDDGSNWKGVGLLYRDTGKPVPKSVVIQIENARQRRAGVEGGQ
ncbi:hypothetical protein [Defluviimonas salinarum]|uniref:Uncharacterized protein n=1 Tax=Defluviimonas salinarum TaxID=2992147 RepID=A0ABT3J7A9_9RHOB|nr:hypothetical protein [Defluviimonas salinarum]MCW3783563.1 hypothetical protein [Defluviimonas salinarum]